MGDSWYLSTWRLSLRNTLGGCGWCRRLTECVWVGEAAWLPLPCKPERGSVPLGWRPPLEPLLSLLSALSWGSSWLWQWTKALRSTWMFPFKCTCWMPPQSNWFYEWSTWNVRVTALNMLSLFSSGLTYTLQMVLWHGWQLSLIAEKIIKLLQVFGKWFQ